MIESIEFVNFKALRKTTLPLAPFTLLLGPNGSGKSSVLQALQAMASLATSGQCGLAWRSLLSVTAENSNALVEAKLKLRIADQQIVVIFQWTSNGPTRHLVCNTGGSVIQQADILEAEKSFLSRMQVYTFDFNAIAQPVPVHAGAGLALNGAGLAAVLDDLKDNYLERWDSLLAEMREWLPEYDTILFDKPAHGQKSIALRTKKGAHRIPATELSQGTLVALALLTLAYLPNPPSLVGLEEIDRGLHPRLLRHLQDALYRLAYPESASENRAPIQVIATTHSPYLLDLYRDHPEEVVLAQKEGLEVSMHPLKDVEHLDEILGESPLSEVWYSGVLGGASVKP